MTTKIAINGFGRIGRLCVRAALQHDDVEIVAINSTSNPEGTAHLFQYDSTHGTYRGEVSYTEDSLVVDGKKNPSVIRPRPQKSALGRFGR